MIYAKERFFGMSDKKIKTVAEKIKKTVLLEDDSILWKSEIEGNKLVTKVMLFLAILLVGTYFATKAGLFVIEMKYMKPVLILGLVEIFIPYVICKIFKGERKWIKAMLLLSIILVCAQVDSVLTYDVPIIMSIPAVLSIRYYDKRVTITTSVITALAFAVSCWYGCLHGQLNLCKVPLQTGDVINIVDNSLRASVSLHGFDMDAYVLRSLRLAFLPKLMIYSVIAVISTVIAGVGREMVFAQDHESRKHERIASELDLASDIQGNMLPKIFPDSAEKVDYALYAKNVPAKEVGGDFYDFFKVDENTIAIVMADVSGKGVPAALFMVIAKTLIKDHAQLGVGPAETFTRVNNLLCEGNDAGLFVTAWFGILDLNSGKLTYVNAGHNPPLIKHDGSYEYLKCRPGFVLAGMEGTRYKEDQLTLEKGDGIFLYTDGVTEDTDSAEELYGEERLLQFMNRHAQERPVDKIDALFEELHKFEKGAEQFDDITMLAIDY